MKKLAIVLGILGLSVLAILPLTKSGFFPVHDDTQVARVFEMNKALSDGEFPVRWVEDLGYGYGYPIFNFYAPFAYYVGGVANFFVDSLLATKIMIGIGALLAGVSMYFLAREFFGDAGGMVSASLYVFAPYHALDIYVRGDIAECYAYAFIPVVFYALWKVSSESSWKYVVLGSLGYAGIIISHNLTAMMVTPFLFLFALIVRLFFIDPAKTHTRLYPFLILLLGIGLGAFYILPVFSEMKYTDVITVIGGGSNYKDHFVCLPQLWSGFWGYGGSILGCNDGLSFQLGKIHILLSILSLLPLILLWRSRKRNTSQIMILMFGILGLLFSIFLMFDISKWLWKLLPPMAFFQFPWRFLLLASFFSSLIAGSISVVFEKVLQERRQEIFLGCAFIAVIAGLFYSKYFVPQKLYPVKNSDYISTYALSYTTSRISDEYMPPHFQKPRTPKDIVREPFIFLQGTGSIYESTQKTQIKKATTSSGENTVLLAQIAPFPAWTTTVDGRSVEPIPTTKGYTIPLSKGNHTIEFRFIQTSIEKLGNTLSVASILMLILGIIYRPVRLQHEKKR